MGCFRRVQVGQNALDSGYMVTIHPPRVVQLEQRPQSFVRELHCLV